MKTKLPSLLAATLLAAPNITLAGPGAAPLVKLDSDLNFALVITGEGEDVVRGTRTSNRFVTARMGPREVLAALGREPRVLSAGDEGSEGGEARPFPPGSRLRATPDRGVVVVDRRGEVISEIGMYVQVSVDREDKVLAFESNSRSGDRREDTRTFVGLNIVLPEEMDGAESPESSGNSTTVRGPGTERFGLMNSRRRSTEAVTVNGRVTGTGYRPSLGQVVASGTVSMKGRDTFQVLR